MPVLFLYRLHWRPALLQFLPLQNTLQPPPPLPSISVDSRGFPFPGSLTTRRSGALGKLLGSQVFQMTCNIPVIPPSIYKRAGAVAVELVGHRLQLLAAVRQTAGEDRVAVLHIKVVADGARSPRRAAFA